MSGALCSDWLPERPRWAHLARSGFPAWPRQEKISWPYNESFLNQICSGLKVKYSCIRDWWHSRCQKLKKKKEKMKIDMVNKMTVIGIVAVPLMGR